jgi:arylsulfatase A-like enzyme
MRTLCLSCALVALARAHGLIGKWHLGAEAAAGRGNWKYIDDRGQHFLFDVRSDPGERHDVVQRHADVVRELRSLVAKWKPTSMPKASGAPRPR